MTLRTLVFRLLPLCYQLVYGTPWTIAQADEAARLVREIAALSIVARNEGTGVETQQPCGIEAAGGAEMGGSVPEGVSMRECPFCSSTNITTRVRTGSGGRKWQHAATCCDCNAEGPQGKYATADAAIAAWNRRTPATCKETLQVQAEPDVTDLDARRALR